MRVGCSGWKYEDWRGRLYPEGLPQSRWLEALRRGVRHGRGQLDLLPAGLARRRRALGRADPGGLPVRRQGQPLPHARAPPARDRRRTSSATTSASSRCSTPASSDRWCGSCRRPCSAMTSCSQGVLGQLPPGRHCFEFRHESWFTGDVYAAAGRPRRGARDRRPPEVALPGARADRRLDARAPAPRPARPARQLLAYRARGVGPADRAVAPPGRGARLLQQRLGGLRRGERRELKRRLRPSPGG